MQGQNDKSSESWFLHWLTKILKLSFVIKCSLPATCQYPMSRILLFQVVDLRCTLHAQTEAFLESRTSFVGIARKTVQSKCLVLNLKETTFNGFMGTVNNCCKFKTIQVTLHDGMEYTFRDCYAIISSRKSSWRLLEIKIDYKLSLRLQGSSRIYLCWCRSSDFRCTILYFSSVMHW